MQLKYKLKRILRRLRYFIGDNMPMRTATHNRIVDDMEKKQMHDKRYQMEKHEIELADAVRIANSLIDRQTKIQCERKWREKNKNKYAISIVFDDMLFMNIRDVKEKAYIAKREGQKLEDMIRRTMFPWGS